MIVMCVLVCMLMLVIMAVFIMLVIMMFVVVMLVVMPGIGGVVMLMRLVSVIGLRRLRRIDAGAFDDLAANPSPGRGVANCDDANGGDGNGAVFVLFLGLAMGALVGLDQGLTIGDRDLIIVGMDFAEGEEAVAVAAISMKAACSDGSTRVTLAR